jgi:hypothetical protein
MSFLAAARLLMASTRSLTAAPWSRRRNWPEYLNAIQDPVGVTCTRPLKTRPVIGPNRLAAATPERSSRVSRCRRLRMQTVGGQGPVR